jgi:GxxExxY protein
MHANDTNNANVSNIEIIYKDLSYAVTGVLMSAHNEFGQYAREKQYGDVVERILKEKGIGFVRELRVGNSGNILDMVVENKIALEFKAKRIITKEDYYQTQRYLQETGLKLALLVNFRDKLIKPKRIVRIENWRKSD